MNEASVRAANEATSSVAPHVIKKVYGVSFPDTSPPSALSHSKAPTQVVIGKKS